MRNSLRNGDQMSKPTVEDAVNLDALIAGAIRFAGKVKCPIWPMPVFIADDYWAQLDRLQDGLDSFWVDPRALRPWRTTAMLFDSGDDRNPDALNVFTNLKPNEVRGRAFPAPHNLMWKSLIADTHPEFAKTKNARWAVHYPDYLGWIGGSWRVTGRSGRALRVPDRPDELTNQIVNDALLTRLESEYNWHAIFRDVEPGAAPFAIPTTARGALSLFRLRDKPDDVKRRPALRHWVSAHARKRQTGDSVDVREHLRGCTEFTWAGMSVTLRPSAYDLARAA
jgi:hypothetical protein